jgi:hypothetical protein
VGKRTGGRRGDLLLAGIALFCLGILLSFLATANAEVFSAPAWTAVGNVHEEALVQLAKDATSNKRPAYASCAGSPGNGGGPRQSLSVNHARCGSISLLYERLVVAGGELLFEARGELLPWRPWRVVGCGPWGSVLAWGVPALKRHCALPPWGGASIGISL